MLWHSLRRVLRLAIGHLELALGKGRVEGVVRVSVAGEVLLEAGELAHPLLVCLKVGVVNESPGVLHTLCSAQSSKVVNRLEKLEVREGDLITADEVLAFEALDNGREACFRSVIHTVLLRHLERWHHDLVNEGAVDQGEHLVDPSLILGC